MAPCLGWNRTGKPAGSVGRNVFLIIISQEYVYVLLILILFINFVLLIVSLAKLSFQPSIVVPSSLLL